MRDRDKGKKRSAMSQPREREKKEGKEEGFLFIHMHTEFNFSSQLYHLAYLAVRVQRDKKGYHDCLFSRFYRHTWFYYLSVYT